jgi:hypothetical protein
MKKVRLLRSLALVIGLSSATSLLAADDIPADLSAGQISLLKKGGQIVLTEDVEGKPWPRVTVYQVVNATPEEVAAVFFDYEDNKAFVPNVLKSEISKRITACTTEIDYGVNVPILPDEFYTVRNTIKMLSPEHYRFDWKLVRAVHTKDSVGSFCMEPLEGKTLIRYQNLVTPGSSMAGLLRKTAISQMKDAATAIATRAEKLKTANPAQLNKQVEALRAALKAG